MTEEAARFKEQLSRQLGFIERSCAAFDAGHEDEAVRVATTLRVLVHDTKKQTSLLGHLKAKTIRLLTTASTRQLDPNIVAYEGFLGLGGSGLRPKLGGGSTTEFLLVDDWWRQTVLVERRTHYPRSIAVLGAAEKDGGGARRQSPDPRV